MTIAAIVGAAILAFVLVLVALWVAAPTRQRDELRELLSKVTPRLDVRIPSFLEDEAEVNGASHHVFALPVEITNQETSLQLSLDVELLAYQGDLRVWSSYPDERDRLPLRVTPMDTLKEHFVFRMTREADRGRRVTVPQGTWCSQAGHRLSLRITDRVSGTAIEVMAPGHYPKGMPK